jgi:murein DD-endopeptidase MepM/ murein hydrolase activator NlpD
MISPVPGTGWRNNGGYDGDSGLDIIIKPDSPVVSPASGLLEYAEEGHTPWWEDTSPQPGFQPPWSIRIKLNVPLVISNITYRWIWFTHMSYVEPSIRNRTNIKIKRGQALGKTGIGNKVPHLHFGIVADRSQTITLPHYKIAEMIWGKRK